LVAAKPRCALRVSVVNKMFSLAAYQPGQEHGKFVLFLLLVTWVLRLLETGTNSL
jgi:hypothetical protein